MRLLNWRVAVVAAALAITGTASAQDPYAVPNTRGYVMSLPAIPAPPVYKYNGHVANVAREAVVQSSGNYWCSNCQNGQNCNNGAGSCKADLGFAFGPSKSFFAPCGPRLFPDCGGGRGCGHGGGSGEGFCCKTAIYGRGPAGPWSHCTYDSFLNH